MEDGESLRIISAAYAVTANRMKTMLMISGVVCGLWPLSMEAPLRSTKTSAVPMAAAPMAAVPIVWNVTVSVSWWRSSCGSGSCCVCPFIFPSLLPFPGYV